MDAFKGTIFRLPLRQVEDKDLKEHLSQELFSYEKLLELMVDEIQPRVSDYLLFADDVKEIEFLVLPPGTSDPPQRLFSVLKTVTVEAGDGTFNDFCGQVTDFAVALETYKTAKRLGDEPKPLLWEDDATWMCRTKIVTQLGMGDSQEKDYAIAHSLLRKGLAFNLAVDNVGLNLLPRISVALPLGSDKVCSFVTDDRLLTRNRSTKEDYSVACHFPFGPNCLQR